MSKLIHNVRVYTLDFLSWCLSVCLSQPGTDWSPGKIETSGVYRMIA